MNGISLNTGTEPFLALLEYWNEFTELSAVTRTLAVVGVAVTLAVVVVGLFPEYGERAAHKARRHSVTTTFLGALVGGLFAGSVGALWYGAARSDVVSMLAAPVLFVLIAFGVVWIMIGLVALGEFVAARGGRDDASWGVVVVAVLAAAGTLYPPFGAAVLVVAALLGFGAGIRTNPFGAQNDERVVPPRRKV
jgi:hypothetical protein